MKTGYELTTKALTSSQPSYRRTLIGHISELQQEIERLRDDNLQLRAALSIYSDLARQSLLPEQRSSQ